jgi:hypothetical protein
MEDDKWVPYAILSLKKNLRASAGADVKKLSPQK